MAAPAPRWAFAELSPARLEAALQGLVDDYRPLDDVFNSASAATTASCSRRCGPATWASPNPCR
jgi:hypothetical protein